MTVDDAEGPPDRALITSIAVEGLFGRYDYAIEVPRANDGRLVLLHGGNGTGKTTLLRLLWNILSSADNRNHRTHVAQVPFRRLSIAFANGASLTCRKSNGLLGNFDITVKQPALPDIVAGYEVDEHLTVPPGAARRRPARARDVYYGDGPHTIFRDPTLSGMDEDPAGEESKTQYLEFLEQTGFMPLFLADDRTLYTDDEEITRLRDRFAAQQEERRIRGQQTRSSDLAAQELRMTLSRLTDWSRRSTLGGQNTGSVGANSIYRDVLRQLASDSSLVADSTSSPDDLLVEVAEIGQTSARFEEFDLVPSFPSDDYLQLLADIGNQDGNQLSLAQQILMPYLASLRTRYSALNELEVVIRKLVTHLNDFLEDKTVGFSPAKGLMISSPNGEPLDPTSLSSGERQLVMLFCTAVLARRDSRLFIIDEPELSLGVKWQRKLIEALLSLTEGTAMQLVVATHSIEISSGNPEALVGLK